MPRDKGAEKALDLDLSEANAAYLRQGLEVATRTNFVDLESVHAHARHMLESCDGGRLMLERFRYQVERAETAEREVERLTKLIDTPHTKDFIEALPLEAAHQIKRWGVEHDDGKAPEDWFWLVGYLAGKCLHAAKTGDVEKAKHHTVSTAAVMLNWFRRLTGDDETFRPGIASPIEDADTVGAANKQQTS